MYIKLWVYQRCLISNFLNYFFILKLLQSITLMDAIQLCALYLLKQIFPVCRFNSCFCYLPQKSSNAILSLSLSLNALLSIIHSLSLFLVFAKFHNSGAQSHVYILKKSSHRGPKIHCVCQPYVH